MSEKQLWSRINGGNTAYKRSEVDFYPTPPEATIALLEFLRLPEGTKIWECACGEGHMVNVFRDAGFCVIGTDIQSGTDFLTADLPDNVDWIITNPPFSLSQKFIERCIEHGKPFAMLLKSQYWHAKKRKKLFDRYAPSFVLPLTWRPDFLFKKRGAGSPLMDVMWCVWQVGNRKTVYIPLDKPEPPKGE